MLSGTPPLANALIRPFLPAFVVHQFPDLPGADRRTEFVGFILCPFAERYNQLNVTDYSNPLRGIVPKVVHKDDVDDAALVELIEKLEGEVGFDAYVKALMSAPEVLIDKGPGLRAATEEAAIVLKDRPEVGEVASRIRKRVSPQLEPFVDDLRLIKPSRKTPPKSNG
jgi:hypothetical protein